MNVRVRFAPSPTGFLHIGGVRTALFNFLFAQHNGGKFLLRIEDTDRKRSENQYLEDILQSLQWLGIDHDEEIVLQSQRLERHKEVIEKLISEGKAYRFLDPETATEVIKLKIATPKKVIINDLVQGKVEVDASDYQDMIICRSDGSPVYMFAVVVDDHDMTISHVIRGVDHLTNTVRQILIYKALDWEVPEFAHIGLINGTDGKKLSKRHGAVSTNEFRAMGFLPEALNNCLFRLGWSHEDDELITMQQAKEWFDLGHVNAAPSQFDWDKLLGINNYYLQKYDFANLLPLLEPFLQEKYGDNFRLDLLNRMLPAILERSNTLREVIEKSDFLINRNFQVDVQKSTMLQEKKSILNELLYILKNAEWNRENLKNSITNFCKEHNLKKSAVMPVIRICLTGTMQSPDLLDIMIVLGIDESSARIARFLDSSDLSG